MRRQELLELERILKALANVNRLELLQALRRPRRYTELHLTPSRAGEPGSKDRPIARQAVLKHLRELEELGIVVPGPEGEPQYVLNHPRLFALVEELRVLTQAELEQPMEGMATADLDAKAAPPSAQGPHLVLVRGVGEGRAFTLTAATLGAKGAWVIGRKRGCTVPLDYDPFVSTEHAHLLQREGKFFLVDLPGNRNGTVLNGRKMARGAVGELKAGDILGVGRSLLVFRSG